MRSVEFKYMNLVKAYNKLKEVSELYDGSNEMKKNIRWLGENQR